MSIAVSFYVLSDTRAQDILGFVCGLTQTAINKSDESLIIVSDNDDFLAELDEALWSHNPASFIPHIHLTDQDLHDATRNPSAANPIHSIIDNPVMLASHIPAHFHGMALNIAHSPIDAALTQPNINNRGIHITRILEIIRPDDASMQRGRDNYAYYRKQQFELTHFKV